MNVMGEYGAFILRREAILGILGVNWIVQWVQGQKYPWEICL